MCIRDSQNALELIEKYNWTEIVCVSEGKLRSIEDIHEEIYERVMTSGTV